VSFAGLSFGKFLGIEWLVGDRLGAYLVLRLSPAGCEVCSKEYKWAHVDRREYLSFRADEVHALKTMYPLFSRPTKGIIQAEE
jgi:hypothetical protein